MKKLVITLSTVGILMAVPGCLQMPTKIERKPATGKNAGSGEESSFSPVTSNKTGQKR